MPTYWVFIGDSDNVRQALFDHLNRPSGCIQSHSPASFSYEEAPSAERTSRRDALIKKLRPACNSSNHPEWSSPPTASPGEWPGI
jgi:hypothetical protein